MFGPLLGEVSIHCSQVYILNNMPICPLGALSFPSDWRLDEGLLLSTVWTL